MAYYSIEEGVLLHRTPPWSRIKYRQDHKGKGDCIFRTAMYAMIKQDENTLYTLTGLLHCGRRWPRGLDHPGDHKHMIISWLTGPVHHNKTLKKWIPHPRYRSSNSMTRDPYIMVYCAAYMMNRPELVDCLKVPWYLRRPDLMAWVKYLRTGKHKHKRRYERWSMATLWMAPVFGLPGYTLHLMAWMAWVAKSQKIQQELKIFTPHWNYLVKQLIHHPLAYLDEIMMNGYLSREGYLWKESEHITGLSYPPLTAGEICYLDRDIMNYVRMVNKNRRT